MISKSLVIALTILLVFLIQPAHADEVDYTPLAMAYVGVLFVNSGLTIANGITTVAGTSNVRNGQFGLVFGLTTTALSALLYASNPGDDDSSNAWLVLGGSGLAAAATGGLAIWSSPSAPANASISPHYWSGQHSYGLMLTVKY